MEPRELFEPWEAVVTSWDEAVTLINELIQRATDSRDLAWRGVHDATFALHSSIFRRIGDSGIRVPTESEVVALENRLLDQARRRWRYDNLNALELLAHIQHYGGPTRLLDVSLNPFVALWFAVERQYRGAEVVPDVDGRVFAFDVTNRQIELDQDWGVRELPWINPPNDWSYELPRLWRPPSYNDRIPAQNSAFLIGGVPKFKAGSNARYRKKPGDGTGAATWSADEVRSATSVTLFMSTRDRALRSESRPTFTFRVVASAKSSIRATLENRFGFNAASMYPDLFGLAQHVAKGV